MKNIVSKRTVYDLLFTLSLLLATTGLSFLLFYFVSDNPANIALFYMLGVISIARFTSGYFYGVIASIFGVAFINCFFTYPYLEINFILPDYPFTFFCILTVSLLTSATTSHLKRQAETLALRERQLFEADKEKMRANLLRAISHDLRTPLTSILGSISSFEENDASYSREERREMAENIYGDASWLLNMVENLLSVTRIQADASQLTTSPEMVEEVVAEAVARLKKRIPRAEIHVSIPAEILMIPMDAMLIEQVLINLMENSVVHSHSSAPIQLLVESQPDTICFRIIDFGIGLDEKQLDRIFDGSASSKASDAHKGMGIGLSICKTIITAHNGELTAKNHEEGAEFLFTLPKGEDTCPNSIYS